MSKPKWAWINKGLKYAGHIEMTDQIDTPPNEDLQSRWERYPQADTHKLVYTVGLVDNMPENQTVPWIQGVFSTLKKAQECKERLDKQCSWGYHVIEYYAVDCVDANGAV